MAASRPAHSDTAPLAVNERQTRCAPRLLTDGHQPRQKSISLPIVVPLISLFSHTHHQQVSPRCLL